MSSFSVRQFLNYDTAPWKFWMRANMKSMFGAVHHKKIFNQGVGKCVLGVVPTMPPHKTMCSLSYTHHAHNAYSHTTFSYICMHLCICISIQVDPAWGVTGRKTRPY